MGEFMRAAARGEIAPGDAKAVELDGRRIAIFNLDGNFYAIDDVCPHRGASLSRGAILDGGIVSCPLHNWEFDIRTGDMHSAPGVESFAVKIEGDEIWVKV